MKKLKFSALCGDTEQRTAAWTSCFAIYECDEEF